MGPVGERAASAIAWRGFATSVESDSKKSPRSVNNDRSRKILHWGHVFAVWSASALIVVLAGFIVLRTDLAHFRENLETRAEMVYQAVSEHLSGGDAILSTLAGLHQVTERVNSKAFTSIVQALMTEHPYYAVIAFLSWVPAEQRAEFEASMRREGLSQFRIHDLHGNPIAASSGTAETHLAISFIQSTEPWTARLLGMDVLSEPVLAAAALRAIESGVRITKPYAAFSDREQDYVSLKASYFRDPVPSTARGSSEHVRGVFMLVLDTERVVSAIRATFPEIGIRLGAASSMTAETVSVKFVDSGTWSVAALLPRVHIRRVLRAGQAHFVIDMHDQMDWSVLNLEVAMLFMALAVIFCRSMLITWRNRQATSLEREMTQDALYREKERAEVTLQSIGDGVIATDIDGRVQYLNPVAEDLTGVRNSAVFGRQISQVLTLLEEKSGEPLQGTLQALLGAFQTEENYLLVNGDGHGVPVDYTASPLRNRGGTTIGAVLVLRDVSRERELASELSYQAAHDPLTGLPNRREFEARLDAALGSAHGEELQHALCYLDLDQFKLVNDTSGHAAGDQLLKQLTSLLTAQMREQDVLARLGGDEFGVLLQTCSVQMAMQTAERLRKVVEDFRFYWQDKVFDVGASIGVVPITRESHDLIDVLSAADIACYAAKDRGRNCVHLYRAGDQVIARRRGEMQWLPRIQAALDQDRFALYLQSIGATGAQEEPAEIREFLTRMLSPVGDLIPPMAFIPAAERYDLMPRIDRWVIDHALAAVRDVYDSPTSVLFTINISGQSVSQGDLANFVVDRLDAYDVSPERICFEITETTAISNFSQAASFIQTLHEYGCKFALDDFGAGLSSFAYLKHLPVDFLKIEGQFVTGMVSDLVDRAMVESINGIGQVLGVRTIAESVENKATLDLLREIGVNYAQGFHIAKPVPVIVGEQDRERQGVRA
jgi:diguanylate cyclase (GGDEF)-like protein/PAS domain S-box-containing protein